MLIFVIESVENPQLREAAKRYAPVTEIKDDMTLKKHVRKRTTIFGAILAIITLLFYVDSFFSVDGFRIFEFFITLVLLIFFSIAFLFFEALELKSKNEFANQKFNLIVAIGLTIFLIITLIWLLRGVAYAF